ncbi:MAG: hypothetical protein D6739_01880 [Nitrospirae bacterium]|nr:MAG: hypothetical protein D6739_01880 [Nitrospirota bacterium]
MQLAGDVETLPGHARSPHLHRIARPLVSWWHGNHATGSWFGLRPRLDGTGIVVEGSWLSDTSLVLEGGARRRAAGRYLLDVNATFDLERLAGLRGATLFVDGQRHHGREGSADAGDLQGVSGFDAEDRLQIAEAWLELRPAAGLRIKLGKVDANGEFAYVDAAAELVHASAGMSPTLLALPTYPDPAWSLNLFADRGGLHLGLGVYDGATLQGEATGDHAPRWLLDGERFWIGEAAWRWPRGRLAAGLWHYEGRVERLDGGGRDGTGGRYLTAEAAVAGDPEGRGLRLFLQWGSADDAVSEVRRHLGAGLRWGGPLTARPDDALIAYASRVTPSRDLDPATRPETATELTYRLQLTPFLALQPDLQWIRHPGGAGLDDTTLVGLRVEVVL